MLNIKQGENALLTKFLKKKDKSDFARSLFSSMTLDLIQKGAVIQTYTFVDSPVSYLRAGVATNEVIIEISTTVSAKFSGGKVIGKFTILVPDASLVEGTFKNIITEELLNVEQTP